MHFLRKLLREIHRRSVWQVLAIYLAGSWGLIEAVDFLTVFAGLPAWTPAMASVLLAIGVPIIVATAFIQEGVPGLTDDPHEAIDPHELEGLTPDQVHRDPDAHPLAGAGIFTWRNAILGGVCASALLLSSVSAYLLMWAFGIGPVGSLVAQGVISEREPILLADFENRTSDETLAMVVVGAMRVDLLESETVTLVEGGVVDEAMRSRGLSSRDPLTAEVARDIALDEGIRLVVAGDLSEAPGGYVVTASILGSGGPVTLARFHERAESEEDLLEAVDRLSHHIREKAGERLRDIRAGEPLGTVTTPSLGAFRLFAQAREAGEAGDELGSVALLRAAVARDTAFAMAWRRLAVAYATGDGDLAREVDAASAAFRHRDRLTLRERLLAEGFYHRTVTDDTGAAVEAYMRVLEDHPHDGEALNQLGLILRDEGRFAEARGLFQRAVDGPGRSRAAFGNLVRAVHDAGDAEEAERLAADWAERYPFGRDMVETRMLMRVAAGDFTGAEAVSDSSLAALAGDRDAQMSFRAMLADLNASRGRLAEARALQEARLEIAERHGLAARVLDAELALDRLELMAGGDTVETLTRMDRRVQAATGDDPQFGLLPAYRAMAEAWSALGRDAERADYWWGQAEAALPVEVRGTPLAARWGLWREATVRHAEGDHAAALEAFRELRRAGGDPGGDGWWVGAELAAIGDPEGAIAEFEELLQWPGLGHAVDRERLSPDVLPELARLYEQVGRLDEAAQAWQELAERFADADAPLRSEVTRARSEAARLARGAGVR